jgi:predicted esterase
MLKIQFVHGLEGSPQGRKALFFKRHFNTNTPYMDTSNFSECVRQQAQVLREFSPDLLVGSSFGGAVVMALLERSLWSGPTLLLAPAAFWYNAKAALPESVPITIVHGRNDSVINIEDSRKLVAAASGGRVRLLEVDDAHDLGGLVESGQLAAIACEAYQWSIHSVI